jgi:hypothetical protein
VREPAAGVAEREAPAEAAAAHRRPAVVRVGRRVAALQHPVVVGTGTWRGEERGRRRAGLTGGEELGARPGDEGTEEVVGADGEAGERPPLVVVVDEEQAHDLGGAGGVQRSHPLEHGRGGFPCVHGGGSETERGVGSRV